MCTIFFKAKYMPTYLTNLINTFKTICSIFNKNFYRHKSISFSLLEIRLIQIDELSYKIKPITITKTSLSKLIKI